MLSFIFDDEKILLKNNTLYNSDLSLYSFDFNKLKEYTTNYCDVELYKHLDNKLNIYTDEFHDIEELMENIDKFLLYHPKEIYYLNFITENIEKTIDWILKIKSKHNFNIFVTSHFNIINSSVATKLINNKIVCILLWDNYIDNNVLENEEITTSLIQINNSNLLYIDNKINYNAKNIYDNEQYLRNKFSDDKVSLNINFNSDEFRIYTNEQIDEIFNNLYINLLTDNYYTQNAYIVSKIAKAYIDLNTSKTFIINKKCTIQLPHTYNLNRNFFGICCKRPENCVIEYNHNTYDIVSEKPDFYNYIEIVHEKCDKCFGKIFCDGICPLEHYQNNMKLYCKINQEKSYLLWVLFFKTVRGKNLKEIIVNA